jgi:hypothetical protein
MIRNKSMMSFTLNIFSSHTSNSLFHSSSSESLMRPFFLTGDGDSSGCEFVEQAGSSEEEPCEESSATSVDFCAEDDDDDLQKATNQYTD